MKPNKNDVLSGRGAGFNQHPGNEEFRKMINMQKGAFMAGTKKQKMDISKAIVEAIYSQDPPGRFLKQCPESGQWNELSQRDAADRVAQAMAYAVRGKDETKRRREELRRSRRLSQQKSKNNDYDDDDMGRKSTQNVDRSVRLQRHETTNQSDNNHSTSVTHHELAARRIGAVGTWNNDTTQSATDLLRVPGYSNLQQQLHLLQPLQHSSAEDNSSTSESINQNGLIQRLVQTLLQQAQQEQQLQQQQQQLLLQLQYTLGPPNNPLGQLLQSQSALQPALNVGISHYLLNQAQQQQQQQLQQPNQLLLLQQLLNQHNVIQSELQQPNQLLLLQQLLNQHNVIQSSTSPVSISTSTPILAGHQSQPATNTNHPLLNPQQQWNHASSNALLLGSVLNQLHHQPSSNTGTSIAPQPTQSQHMNQILRSALLHQSQPVVSTSAASSNNNNNQQPQLRQTLQATLQQLRQHLQGPPPPLPLPSLNSTGTGPANVPSQSQSTRPKDSEVGEQSESEDAGNGD